MELSLEERLGEISKISRAFQREDLLGARFRSQLRLAHTEGLLLGLLQDTGVLDHQGRFQTASACEPCAAQALENGGLDGAQS